VPALLGGLLAVSVVGAATSPGNQSFQAKWADWLRAHHAGLLAQRAEEIYYSLEAPAKGGRPKGLNEVPGTVAAPPVPTADPGPTSATAAAAHAGTSDTATSGTATGHPGTSGTATGHAGTSSTGTSGTATGHTGTSGTATGHTGTSYTGTSRPTARLGPTKTVTRQRPGLPPPSPVPLVVRPALPGEGRWQPTGPLVDGVPAMYVAQFRADDVYTSEITSAVWLDTRLLHLKLVPGSTEPGGTWNHPPYVTASELPFLVAAFNGGFRFQDAKGGIYLEGKVGVPLLHDAASIVIYKDGGIDIGSWGQDVKMGPDVESVLQNAVLLVDNGKVAPSATYTDNAIWGYTLGGGYVVPRSGIGITADGAIVYVAGPALTARSLAESLQRAGAVRAMTLDINPEWVTFNFYSHSPSNPSQVSGTKLYPQMQRSADRYLPPVLEARDFYEVLLPGAPLGS